MFESKVYYFCTVSIAEYVFMILDKGYPYKMNVFLFLLHLKIVTCYPLTLKHLGHTYNSI
jgi:hypothetical protein